MPIITFNKGKRTGSPGSQNGYNGSKDMGDLSNWRILTSDANKILCNNYRLLSERSGTLYHTYPPVRAAINKKVQYGIGPGLVFRSQPDYELLGMSKEDAVIWGRKFQKIVDHYQREMNFYQKQPILARTAYFGGDSLLFFERKNGDLTDLIEVSGDQINDKYDTSAYTLGIKHDEWYRRKGIMKIDGKTVDFQDSNGNQNVIQLYYKELSRQLRGYPLAYSIINLARNDDTHTDAITHRAVLESVIMAVFKGNGTDINKQIENLAKKNRSNRIAAGIAEGISNVWTQMTGTAKLGPGNIIQANNTEDLEFTDLKTPSNNFKDYKDYMINYVGMAMGVPPEVIKAMYSTSFTAHKGAFNDFIKSYMMDRFSFQRIIMEPVVREIAKDAIRQGLISAPGFFDGGKFIQSAYLRGMFLGPVPGHINPLVEVKADELSVKNEFKLRSDIAAMNGYDFDIMSAQWADEQEDFTNSPQSYTDKVAADINGGGADA